MTIKRGYRIAALGIVLLLGALIYLVAQLYEGQDQLIESEHRHHESFRIANELRASSDQLTLMARLYTVTGNPLYEKYFFDILAIRNGEKPRPAQYGPTYWDLVLARQQAHEVTGQPRAFVDMMRALAFTETEFGLLREAQARSDRLVGLEREAFAAMKGPRPDPGRARQLTWKQARQWFAHATIEANGTPERPSAPARDLPWTGPALGLGASRDRW